MASKSGPAGKWLAGQPLTLGFGFLGKAGESEVGSVRSDSSVKESIAWEEGLSPPGLGAAVLAGLASPRGRARLRVEGTISEGRWR